VNARSLAALLALALSVCVTAAAAPSPVRVTVIGDSVAASLDYAPAGAVAALVKGLDVQLDLRVCRRLATAGCPYHGAVPSSALDVVRADGTALGPVLVVAVGYNDDPRTYPQDMTTLVRAALARGVRTIVWLTLHESKPIFVRTNAAIRAGAKRWPEIEVADFGAWSNGKPWFRSDGLHLNPDGAAALATFLRPYLLRASNSSGRTSG
jgi:hypothetical protein